MRSAPKAKPAAGFDFYQFRRAVKSSLADDPLKAYHRHSPRRDPTRLRSRYFPDAAKEGSTIRQCDLPGKRTALGYSLSYFGLKEIGVADELRNIGRSGPVVDFARRRHLFQFALSEQGDTVGHDHGFFLFVRDENESDADLALQRFQFDLHLAAEAGVERGERLVEQQQARTIDQGASQRDTLLLATADLGGFGGRVDVIFTMARRCSTRVMISRLGTLATRKP